MRGSARAGFTLLEVVLAIAIGALLLLAVHAVLVSADASRRAIERRTHASRSAAAVFSLMARDLAAATVYRDVEVGFAGTREPGGNHRIDFLALVRSEREVAGRSSLPTEVGYVALRDPAGGPRYRLYRREQFYRDGTPTRGGTLEPVCDDIVRFRARYHDGTSWRDTWTESRRLPRAVEVELVLAVDGESGGQAEDVFVRQMPIYGAGFGLTLDRAGAGSGSGSGSGLGSDTGDGSGE